MRTLQATLHPVDHKALRFRSAAVGDYDTLITESVRIQEGDDLRIVFQVMDEAPEDLIKAFRTINYNKSSRTAGLTTQARVLGSLPRITIRRDYCTMSGMASEHPAAHATFLNYARKASSIYKEFAPTEQAAQQELVESKVKPGWRISDSVFTSGIVNWDNPLNYHTDTGNFPGTWNAMYALARDMSGGQLVVPEFRIAFSFAKPAFIIFEAAKFLHGVTPLRKLSSLSYRYSVVFYALQQLCNCLSPAEELDRIQKVKTVRELKRAGIIERDPKEAAALAARVLRGQKARAERGKLTKKRS